MRSIITIFIFCSLLPSIALSEPSYPILIDEKEVTSIRQLGDGLDINKPVAESVDAKDKKTSSIEIKGKELAITADKEQTEYLVAMPVNNKPVIFNKKKEDDEKRSLLSYYVYGYRNKDGSVGDKFVLPSDLNEFVASLPHGNDSSPQTNKQISQKVVSVFDDEYQDRVVEDYYKMKYRMLAPTIR